ncbi:MAG TPA: signal peptidase II [Vicinamibacterales bacterium]|nr:signal peptidase II [Vicinamibacterales bacterium]
MMTRIGVRLVLFTVIGTSIGCDRVTKHVAATALSETSSRSFLADTIRLEYVENTGAFLGMGADWPPAVRTAIFGVGNAALLLGLVIVAMRRRWPSRALLGVGLCVAGGASNLVDRITYGMVIDFMNVGIGPLRTGIFNVADVAIMLGAGVLALEGYRSTRHAPPENLVC